MNCWHCNHELTWVGDHDIQDGDIASEDYCMVTTLGCSMCGSLVEVYYPKEKE